VKRTRLSSRVIDKVLASKRVEISTLEAVAIALNVEYSDLVLPAMDAPKVEGYEKKDRTIQSPLSVTTSLIPSLPRGDEDDPALASAFLSRMRDAMDSYARFKLSHNVHNKNAMIAPREAREYFTAKWPELIHQWLELYCYINSDNKMEIHYVLNSTDMTPAEVMAAGSRKNQSALSLRAHLLVVYKCIGDVSKDAGVQLETWYGKPTMQHLFIRVNKKGKLTSISAKGRLLRISTNSDTNSDNSKNLYILSQNKPLDEVAIPPFGKAELNLKTGKFEKVEELDGPSERPKDS
jgi:hypothetical protein